MEILDAIGNTSLVRLCRVVPPGCAEIRVKLEWENPTGSVKDRMAQAVISRAEEDGRLKPGYTVVEYTGGSTGASLALVCAAKGYRIHIVSSDACSREKLDQMAALGAQLTFVPSEGGRTTKKLILDLFAGTSSGANVVAALRVAQRLGPGATVVTLMADSGLKYLGTDVYRGAR